MSYKIKYNWVSRSMYGIKCPYHMTPIYIVVHNTATDASAQAEISYMRRNRRQVSFHTAIDEHYVVRGIPYDRNAWHAGDGRGTGNMRTIGIEICRSKSGGWRFTQAEKNAAKYIAQLLKERGWGIERVKQHHDFSPWGKNCPHRTRARGWNRFLNMIRAEMNESPVYPPNNNKLSIDGSWGRATTRLSQKVFGVSQTSIVANQPSVNRKYLPNCDTSSWQFKSVGYKGGSSLIKAIQKYLKTKDLYSGSIDGYCGKNTIKGMQRLIGVTADGSCGRNTVKAWQRYINSRL